MPIFRTTHNIFKAPWEGDYFDENWMNSNTVVYPPSKPWDYSRELQIEDIDLWEVIQEGGGGTGVYASWSPYAEFFMVVLPTGIETFYGIGAQKSLKKFLGKKGISLPERLVWVDEEDLWLYRDKDK